MTIKTSNLSNKCTTKRYVYYFTMIFISRQKLHIERMNDDRSRFFVEGIAQQTHYNSKSIN